MVLIAKVCAPSGLSERVKAKNSAYRVIERQRSFTMIRTTPKVMMIIAFILIIGLAATFVVVTNSAYGSIRDTTMFTTSNSSSIQVGIYGSETTTSASRSVCMLNPLPTCVGSSQVASPATYYPSTIVVVLGVNDTITWTNKDSFPHTVTSDDGVFDSGVVDSGSSWSYTFTTPGTYGYHCSYDPRMIGTVMVKSE